MNETLKDLLEYLQNKIDSGEHKIFFNDLGWDVKTIDCINAINEQQEEIERLNNIINELKWKPIEEYDKGNYDWVLVKYFDGDYECVPCVAEKRFDKWYNRNDEVIESDVKYFIDMQQIDKLQELKGDGSNDSKRDV